VVVTTPVGASVLRPRRTSPSDVLSARDQHQQPQVLDDVDDDVTTTTSGSYVIDMTENGGEWRRQIAGIYEGILV